MVEFVLLNLILIPLFLYAIFLMDAAYLKLDLQETVVSGVWDFSQRNTEPTGFAGSVSPMAPNKAPNDGKNRQMEMQAAERAVRIAYADHTSAFDDGAEADQPSNVYGETTYLGGNGNGDKAPSPHGHQKHHTGFGAQYTYKFNKKAGEDTEFLCSFKDDTGWNPDPNFTGFANSGYATGAEVKCDATGYIYNYVIPQSFLQEFSKVEMSKLKQRKDTSDQGTHEYQGEGGNISNIVAYETAGISFNTWALRNGANNAYSESKNPDNGDITYVPNYNGALAKADLRAPANAFPSAIGDNSPEANPFYRRVQYIYTLNGTAPATYGMITAATAQFTAKAMSEKLMTISAIPGTSGGLLPNIAGVFVTARYKPNAADPTQNTPLTGANQFQSQPYAPANNAYQTASNARGVYYLGCKSPENPDCF
jgi:hypothetical protein